MSVPFRYTAVIKNAWQELVGTEDEDEIGTWVSKNPTSLISLEDEEIYHGFFDPGYMAIAEQITFEFVIMCHAVWTEAGDLVFKLQFLPLGETDWITFYSCGKELHGAPLFGDMNLEGSGIYEGEIRLPCDVRIVVSTVGVVQANVRITDISSIGAMPHMADGVFKCIIFNASGRKI